MRKIVSVALAATLVTSIAACGAKEEAGMDSAAAAMTAEVHTMADYAGTWSMLSTLEGVEEQVPSTLTGAADAMTWTLSLADRPNVPTHVMVVGDSLIGETDPFESVLRAGVMVTVRTASALTSPNTMQGTMIATYTTANGEEKVAGTTSATRVP